MAVGGSFDMIAGVIPRAPIWVQKIGLEWLYRLGKEPWRLKRQMALVRFLFLVFRERFLHT
jgi:N-acetylglucosaminyldiphosphoundecaprenol N-acetyl-beta-D-mannosaminyltransferase